MAEYPLLIFPEPDHAQRAKPSTRGPKIRLPHGRQQATRLAPQFQRLEQAMEKKRLTLQGSSSGLQPELALVLETIGPIQNFINAVKKIEGLEWLGELEVDAIPPSHGFEDEQNPQKPLKGRLFLMMTDQRALEEIQRLFRNWQNDPDKKFPRGFTPLKQAFAHLHTIRPWDAKDRIRETNILQNWEFRVQQGQEVVPFEAELWFRESFTQQQQAESNLRNIIEIHGGEVVQQCTIPQIAYHSILGNIPIALVEQIAGGQDVRLLQCDDVMYIRPVGQCTIHMPEDRMKINPLEDEKEPIPPQGDPTVALFDGLPLAGHQLLNGRLIIDDPDGFESDYQARERVHGTVMASLICHGDLNEDNQPLTKPLYVRPIMKPRRGFDNQFNETIPDKTLPIDLLHRAVRRLYEGEGTEPPIAPSVRVINLSICDPSRPFNREMSPWARLLDWLSWKYNVLFVVSAGNHSHEIELKISQPELAKLTAVERQKAVIEAIAADTRHRRLLSPAETLNGVTVAATHDDASKLASNHNPKLIDPFNQAGIPSTVSAHGPGYRGAIKPDILLPGGRLFLSEMFWSNHKNATLRSSNHIGSPGQRVAAPGASGELNGMLYTRGTSNATALASRWAAFLLEMIDLTRTQNGASLLPEYDTVLVKTLLVHGADWGDADKLYTSVLKNAQNSRSFKAYIGRFLGYGSPNIAKVMNCIDQRVTILGVGQITDNEAQEFRFPLPPSLSAVTEKRRLTITLGWLSPVNSSRQSYRVAHLWFDPKDRGKLRLERICADHRAVQRGTIQHEVLEGTQAADFQDGEEIVIKVNCRADAGDIEEPVRYGLAVTLEVSEEVDMQIYQEVRERLLVPIPTS